MAIDKINTTAWASIASVTGVAKASIANFGGVDAPSSGAVTSGLIMHLDPGDSSSYSGSGSTWTDLEGTVGNHTLLNGVVYSSADGGSFVFDGSNDFARNTSFNLSTLSAFTVDSWVNPDNSSSDHTILGQFLRSGGYYGPFILYLDIGGAVGYDAYVRLSNNTAKRISTSIANGTIGAWNHVVATFDSTSLKLYVNNSLIGTTATGLGIQNNSNAGFAIGSDRTTGSRYWDGKIATTKIYNRVLSSTEVATNYNATKSRYGY